MVRFNSVLGMALCVGALVAISVLDVSAHGHHDHSPEIHRRFQHDYNNSIHSTYENTYVSAKEKHTKTEMKNTYQDTKHKQEKKNEYEHKSKPMNEYKYYTKSKY
jgi:hypothetical protein